MIHAAMKIVNIMKNNKKKEKNDSFFSFFSIQISIIIKICGIIIYKDKFSGGFYG